MKYVLALLLSLLASPALAGVSCVLPFNIQNGQPADATQVMANYNALVACLGNAAAAGANSDITSLNGLTTPIPKSAGGTPVYVGGTSTGSANAQVVGSTVPGFVLSPGNIVTFFAGFSNTGNFTLNVGGTGVLTVFRHTQLGPLNFVGGEINANDQVMVQYDGTQFQCLSCHRDMVGEVMDYTGTPPAGWLVMDGSCVSQTSFSALFAVIGTNFGSCGAGLFALPDGRGNAMVGLDNQGSNGNANRLSICAAQHTVLGALCGVQQQTISQAELPVVTIPATGLTGSYNPTVAICNTLTTTGCSNGDSNLVVSGTSRGTDPWSNYVGTGAGLQVTMGGNVTLPGGAAGLPTIQPLQFVYKIVKL